MQELCLSETFSVTAGTAISKHSEPPSGQPGKVTVGSNSGNQDIEREGVKLKPRCPMVEQRLERVKSESGGSQRQRDKQDWKRHQEREQGTFFFPGNDST